MKTTIKSTATGMAMLLALVPVLASADTVSDLQAQIQNLMRQLKSLQQQLSQAQASSTGTTTPWNKPRWGNASSTTGMPPGLSDCPEIKRELKRGMRGDDVTAVQQFLQQNPQSGFTGQPTGFFGEVTERAMKKMKGVMGVGQSEDLRSLMKDCMKERREDRKEERWEDRQGMGEIVRGMIAGTVQSVGTNSFIVVVPMSSTTRIVTTTASTTFEVKSSATSAATTGSIVNIAVGAMVIVRGQVQADKSITAASVIILPAGILPPMPSLGGFMGGMMGTMKNIMGGPEDKPDRGGDDR